MFFAPHRIAPGLLLTCAVTLWADPAADTNALPSLAFWDKTVSVRGALGYKDNVLLSHQQPEASGFWQSAFDLTLVRASLDESPNLIFFVSGEDRRYFSSSDVEKEQLLLSQAKISKSFSDAWSGSFLAQYVYADQVFDASSTEQVLEILPVKSQNIEVAPAVARALPWNSSLELKFSGERQIFQTPLDSYWEFGPELTFSKKYGHKSEASLSYTFDHRIYDTRGELAPDFSEIPNTALRFNQHEFEAALNHSWDKARHWRTRTKFLFEISEDNGTGFFDFYRYRFSQRLGYYAKKWEATIEGKVLHYDYQQQPVIGSSELRQTWEYVLSIRFERNLWRELKLFLESEHDKVDSNYGIEQYFANTVMTGFDWEF